MFEDGLPTKKRRLQGACDTCRRKKIKCDSAKMPGNMCSNCLAFGSACTHVLASKGKNKTPATFTNVREGETFGQTLSHKLFFDYGPTRSKVAAILSPSNVYAVPDNKVAVRQTLVEMAQYIHALETELISNAPSRDLTNSPPSSSTPAIPDDHTSYADADARAFEDDVIPSDQMNLLTLSSSQSRFFGKSSNILLLKAAIDVRKQTFGETETVTFNQAKRPEYWTVYPWQWMPDEEPPPLTFPDADLMEELIELYFVNCNPFFPIFHNPSDDRLVSAGIHLHNRQIGDVVLAVCATASRYSNDPRVFSEGAESEQSSGWKWFSQVRPLRTSFIAPPTLYLVQLYCVCILYLQGTSTPETCWILSGIAVRMIQDVGAHRKVPGETKRTVENELWRRAFWAVITIDIYISAFLGRPRATHPDDYDQDLPADCDDEYWETEDPAHAFKQPPGKPSKLSFFLASLKLLSILGIAQRTIYTVNKSDLSEHESRHQLELKVVLRIDSALNEWVDAVPEHLRWDPHRKDQLFFDQSAVLYSTYYYVQILVHKLFILYHPGNKDHGSEMSLPSLAICANAARSCAHVMDIQSRRGFVPLPNVHIALLAAAVVLMLNHWGSRRMGLSANPGKEYSDVYKCINILHRYESRWQVAGRLCDLLEQLLAIGDEHTPSHNPLKRHYEDGEANEQADPMPAAKKPATSNLEPLTTPELNHLFSLPCSTDELSRLPIHGNFEFGQEPWLQNVSEHNSPPLVPIFTSSSSRPQDTEYTPILESIVLPQSHPDAVDTETMTVWSKTPNGYDWDNWGTYLSSVEEFMHTAPMGSLQ